MLPVAGSYGVDRPRNRRGVRVVWGGSVRGWGYDKGLCSTLGRKKRVGLSTIPAIGLHVDVQMLPEVLRHRDFRQVVQDLKAPNSFAFCSPAKSFKLLVV